MKNPIKVTRALISVSDKTGIVPLARALVEKGVEVLSTGGTAKLLIENGVQVTSVDSYTGFPEIMDGRVKTLHPKIHGGLLAVRDNLRHQDQMAQNNIKPIDLVIINLYPFKETIKKPDVTIDEAIENIDIGGPAMLRSAAKNHAFVAVAVDPADYQLLLTEFTEHGAISFQTRKLLAVKAFRHTSDYDATIDTYLSAEYFGEKTLHVACHNGAEMRYGENPHQSAMFFKDASVLEPNLGRAEQIHGKELSYNNIVDGDAALEAVKDFGTTFAAVVVKHMNPCGFATGSTMRDALEAAWSGDPVSAYGGVLALSKKVDLATAEFLKGKFVEILIAPDFDADALEFLRQKSKDIRLLKVGPLGCAADQKQIIKQVIGGFLVQDRDTLDAAQWEVVTAAKFPGSMDLLARFAWKVCKYVKSNAIILAQEYAAGRFRQIGMGAGQPNRVDSLRKLALPFAMEHMGKDSLFGDQSTVKDDSISRMIMASDAFFPFADTVEVAHSVGIRYIVQPGGAKRDDEVIDACNKNGIAMIFTGTRHFRH